MTLDKFLTIAECLPKEQEPCEDAISRKAVHEAIEKWAGSMSVLIALPTREIRPLLDSIHKLPSVNPQEPEWIPVSERLPAENKTVIASTKYGVYPEARYTKENGWEWAYESYADYWVKLEYVTAWMPLPKLYEPQESEGKDGGV